MKRIAILCALCTMLTSCEGLPLHSRPNLTIGGTVSARVTETGAAPVAIDGEVLSELLDNISRLKLTKHSTSDRSPVELNADRPESYANLDGWLVEFVNADGEVVERVFFGGDAFSTGEDSFHVEADGRLEKQLKTICEEVTQ